MAKAMSSWLSDASCFVFRLLVFTLFGNPLSMWFINLLSPRLAAKFARDERYFGPKIYAYYEQRAIKWPFHWSKWWMKIEDMASYSTKKQIKYFLKFSFKNKTEEKVLNAMKKRIFWPDAFEILFFKYGSKKLPLEPETHFIRKGDFTVVYSADITVADFMMRNTRLSYNALETVIKKAVYNDFTREELRKYLASGALNCSQLDLLIDTVSTGNSGGDLQMLGVLIDYVKRYNLRKEHWQRIKEQYPRQFIELLEEAAQTAEQAKFVRSLQDTPQGRSAWENFCRETADIIPSAQGKMTLWQYDIFHKAGHKLCTDAILALLRRSDKSMWKAIFEREVLDDDARMEISSNVNWWPVYREVIKSRNGE